MPEAAQFGRCYACGYDLRGNTSGTCPECGRSAPVLITIHDREGFHYAKAALEQENLVVRAIQPGGVMGAVAIEYGSGTGWLWVDQNDLERAEELLDEMGITAHINTQRPIVDRSEPFCPKCNAELDVFGRTRCSKCATDFDWVEIETPSDNPKHSACPSCGYDLTGLKSERCPECHREVADLDRLVEAATGEGRAEPEGQRSRTKATLGIGALIAITSAIAFALARGDDDTGPAFIAWVAMLMLAWCFLFIAGATAWLLIRKLDRK